MSSSRLPDIIVQPSYDEVMETAMPLHPNPECNVCLRSLVTRINNKQPRYISSPDQEAIDAMTVDHYEYKGTDTRVLRCPISKCVSQAILDISIEKKSKYEVSEARPVYRSTRECIRRTQSGF
jgi:hypothetical protein